METINKQLCESVKSGTNFLIFTHVRPDGDALGSSFGLRDALRASGRGADVVIPFDMPDRYRNFFKGAVSAAIECVSKQWVAKVRHMDANLVRSARLEFQPQIRDGIVAFKHLEMGNGFFCAMRAI